MTPIHHDTVYSPSIGTRYRRLAGPFDFYTQPLMQGMLGYLEKTGARAIAVSEPEGVCVWRLRSECETMEQTSRRLAMLSRQRPKSRIAAASL